MIFALLYVACVQTKTSYLHYKIITCVVNISTVCIGSDYSKNLYSKITDIVKGGRGDGCFTISVMSQYTNTVSIDIRFV